MVKKKMDQTSHGTLASEYINRKNNIKFILFGYGELRLQWPNYQQNQNLHSESLMN